LKPDGTVLALRDADGALRLYPLDGGSPSPVPPSPVPKVQPEERLLRWKADGSRLLLMVPLDGSIRIDEVNPNDGARTTPAGKEIASPPSFSAVQFTRVLLSADGQTTVYGAERRVCTLRIAEGLR
jgi:hypothetical protein